MHYDYYDVELPGDVFAGRDAERQLASLAIGEARERARLYTLPADWSARLVRGRVGGAFVLFRVRRRRP